MDIEEFHEKALIKFEKIFKKLRDDVKNKPEQYENLSEYDWYEWYENVESFID